MTPATLLVIFDNDGVLVDSERLANGILAELMTPADRLGEAGRVFRDMATLPGLIHPA